MSRCPQCIEDERSEAWKFIAPRRFWEVSMAMVTQPPGVVEALADWLGRDGGDGLLLFGTKGSGKTFAAFAVLRACHSSFERVKAVSEIVMYKSLQPDGGSTMDDYTGPDVLLIDDVGKAKASEFTDQELEAIVDQRWSECRPTIITTNLTEAQLERHVGATAFDRLADGSVALMLSRQSQRRRPA